jgi:glycosyltransferase involved in cell wall biosynthesis
MSVTAYIPCFQGARYLPDTITAILRQTRRPDELLVVDDGSTDSTSQVASKYPVQIIRHERNKGLPADSKTALAQARHPSLAAFDVDARRRSGLARVSPREPAGRKVAAAGGRLIENFRATPADLWRPLELSQDLGESRIEMSRPTPKRLGGGSAR